MAGGNHISAWINNKVIKAFPIIKWIIIKNEEITEAGKDFFLYQWENIDNRWLKQNPRAESVDSIGSCFDGMDNDYDGLIDNAEDACKI